MKKNKEKRNHFVAKAMAVAMLTLTVGGVVYPTAYQLTAHAETINTSQVSEKEETNNAINDTSDSQVDGVTTDTESTSNDDESTTKNENAPNENISDVDFTSSLDSILNSKNVKTLNSPISENDAYTIEINEDITINDAISYFAIASSAYNYDKAMNSTDGLNLIHSIETEGIGKMQDNSQIMYNIVSVNIEEDLKYNQNTTLNYKGTLYTLPSEYQALLGTSSGATYLQKNGENFHGAEVRASGTVTESFQSGYTYQYSGTHWFGGTWGFLNLSGAIAYCLNPTESNMGYVSTPSSYGDVTPYFSTLSADQRNLIFAITVAAKENGWGKDAKGFAAQLMIWGIIMDGETTLSGAASFAQSISTGNAPDTTAVVNAANSYLSTYNAGDVNDSKALNQIGVGSGVQPVITQGPPNSFWDDPVGNVTLTKTFANPSVNDVPIVCDQIDIKYEDSGYVDIKTMQPNGSGGCSVTFVDKNAGENFTLTEVRNDSPYYVITDGTANGTIQAGTTIDVSSGGITNTVDTTSLVIPKIIDNSTIVDVTEIVNPADVKVTLTAASGTPAFTNPHDYVNMPMSWATSADEVAYGIPAGSLILKVDNLAPGTYNYTEGFPTYLGGVTTSGSVTITKGGTSIVVGPSLENKISAGNVHIIKDWNNADLNSNINENDLINSSTQINPSMFDVRITSNDGLSYDETFTFDSNYEITTPRNSLPIGSYHYEEIDNSSGASIVIGQGDFNVTHGNTTELTPATGNTVVNKADLGSIEVIKTFDTGDITEYCNGTNYTDIDGNAVTINPEDCQQYLINNIVQNGDVQITLTSNEAINGFAYTETKDMHWDSGVYKTDLFEGLPLGTYIMTETYMAPNLGPIVSAKSVEITSNGQVVQGELQNEVLSGKIGITKRDSDTDGIIGGGIGGNSDKTATFGLWDYDMATATITNNTPIDVITTNRNGYAESREIPLDRITGSRTIFIQELDTPDGYFMNGVATPNLEEGGYVVTLTAADNNTIFTFDYKDVEIEQAEIQVAKSLVDTDGNVLTDKDLSGFEFTLYNWVADLANYGDIAIGYVTDATGEYTRDQVGVTDSDGIVNSDKLLANYSENTINGDPVNKDAVYKLSETGVPNGDEWMYDMVDDEIIAMPNDNMVYYYDAVNILKDIQITINKTDGHGHGIEGVEFTVYNDAVLNSDGTYSYDNRDIVATYTTDANGQIIMDKMSVDETYYIVETQTRIGNDGNEMYTYSSDPIIVTPDYIHDNLDTSGNVIYDTIDIVNTPITTDLTLNKFDDEGAASLNGAQFTLDYTVQQSETAYGHYTAHIDLNETVTYDDLPVYNYDGTYVEYTLTETEAPAGYYLIEPITFHFENKNNGDIDIVIDTNIDDNSDIVTDNTSANILNLYDNRIVVDFNILKLTKNSDFENIETLTPGLDIIIDNGMIDISDNVIDSYIPEGSHSLTGATFEISTALTPEMLDSYDYKVENDMVVKQAEGETWIYDASTLNDYYMLSTEIVDTIAAGENAIINETTTINIDATNSNNTATISINGQDSYVVSFDTNIVLEYVQSGVTNTLTVENGDSASLVLNSGNALKTLTDLNILNVSIDYSQSANIMSYTKEVDSEGHLNMILPIADTNGRPMIYRLEETVAPTGYARIEAPTFIYFTINDTGDIEAHNVSDIQSVNDIKVSTNTTTPNDSDYTFDYDKFFTNLFLTKEVDNENTKEATEHKDTHYLADATDSYDKAVKSIDDKDFVLEVWIRVYNEIKGGNLLIDKDIKDNESFETDKMQYLEDNAENGYEVITEEDLQLLEDINYKDLENVETNKIYTEDALINEQDVVIEPGEYTIDETQMGTYDMLIQDGTDVSLNGESLDLKTDEYTPITLNANDVLKVDGGYLVIHMQTDAEIDTPSETTYEQGELITTVTAPWETMITAETANTYFIQTDNVDIKVNGIEITVENGTYQINTQIGQSFRLLNGSIGIYSANEVTTSQNTNNKVYTNDLTNDYPVIVSDNGEIQGGNVEFRLWNEEVGNLAYDSTLLTTKDGRAYFKNFPIYDDNGKSITYSLQEVGAPSPIYVEDTVAEMSFGVHEDGNLFFKTLDVFEYDDYGNLINVTNTVDDSKDFGLDAITEDSVNSQELYRENIIFHELETRKLANDADEDGMLSPGEELTYTIEVTNNGEKDTTATIQDDLEGLDKYFVIDEEALSQELQIDVAIDEEAAPTNYILSNIDGEITINKSFSGTYDVIINTPTFVKFNGTTSYYDNFDGKVTLNEGDVIEVMSGTVEFNKQVEENTEETIYTLNDLVTGFDYVIPAHSNVQVSFTLTAKDKFDENSYCQNVTNIAQITDENGNFEKPSIELPTVCEPEIEAEKTSATASGDEIISAGEDVTYTVAVENIGEYDANDVFVQDDVVSQLSSYFNIDEETLNQELVINVINTDEFEGDVFTLTPDNGEITITEDNQGVYKLNITEDIVVNINGTEYTLTNEENGEYITVKAGDVINIVSGNLEVETTEFEDIESDKPEIEDGNDDGYVDVTPLAEETTEDELQTPNNDLVDVSDIVSEREAFTNDNIDEETGENAEESQIYTLHDLVEGVTINVPAYTRIEISFTLTALDTLGKSDGTCNGKTECPDITNTANIEVTPGTEEPIILTPEVTNPVECEENTEDCPTINPLENTGQAVLATLIAIAVIAVSGFVLYKTRKK